MLQDLSTNFNRYWEIALIYYQNTTIHIQQRTVRVLQPYSYRLAYSICWCVSSNSGLILKYNLPTSTQNKLIEEVACSFQSYSVLLEDDVEKV
jgi:hypothetical protein